MSKVKWRKFDKGFYNKQLVKLVRINRCQFSAELKIEKVSFWLVSWMLTTLKQNKNNQYTGPQQYGSVASTGLCKN